MLFFSSGSTGKAKGILSAHRGVCLQLWRWPQWYDLKVPPRTWSANGFFWSGNFAMALGGTLSAGGSLLLQRWFDPAEALDLMQAEIAQHRVPVSSLCIAAAVPATTALRWIKTMTDTGPFVRRADPREQPIDDADARGGDEADLEVRLAHVGHERVGMGY